MYRLETTAFFDGELASLVPCNDPGKGEAANDRPANLKALLQMPPMPHLVEQARQWVAMCGTNAPRLNRARLLESRLSQSDRFEYSLQGQPRDPDLDPIEDFIVNNPRGHCEYFATALRLMLRSQGIPARVVVGYKCDGWNKLGKFYQVRQSDAHAWVEAYLAGRTSLSSFAGAPARCAGAAAPGCGSIPRRPCATCWPAAATWASGNRG